MAIKNSLTKDEILAIYEKAINGGASNRYEESIALKDAVLANFKGLFPNFGYGYFYEDSEDEIRVPIALNILFGFSFGVYRLSFRRAYNTSFRRK